jgi:hypothetical protein
MMRRDLRWLVPAALVLAPFLAFGETEEEEEGPRIETRKIVVTDSVCGADGVGRTNHHICVLKRLAEGERLLFFDEERDQLYEVEFESDNQKVMVVNDYAGLTAFARGVWDDENHKVALLEMIPDEPARPLGEPSGRKRG